ncbi:hypothetical protein MSPP1_004118 [Malassezia sp. CBS 17886]|nr:hypothetical protein MSPP1_004118 [Malassezia sp. CBS 17886]
MAAPHLDGEVDAQAGVGTACMQRGEHAQSASDALRDEQHLVVLSGLIGSGKSSFAAAVVETWPELWVRCNQDEMGNRRTVYAAARRALQEGKNVLIDRTNIDRGQRADWLVLARARRLVTSLLFFDTPVELCRARLWARRDHPTIRTPQDAFRVLAMFRGSLVYPSAERPEGFDTMLVLHAAALPRLGVDRAGDAAYLRTVLMRLFAAVQPRGGEVGGGE